MIFYDLSRAARDDYDALHLWRTITDSSAKIESTRERVDDTPAGRFMYSILLAVNALRSRDDGEKVKMGLQRKHEAGGTFGPARLGYLNARENVQGREVAIVTPDPDRAELIHLAFDLFATGEFTITTLTTLLDEAGLRTRPTPKRPSRPLSCSQVHRILRDDFYIGIVTLNKVKRPGRHEPLITAELFERVQQILDTHRASGERSHKHQHNLAGTLEFPRFDGHLDVPLVWWSWVSRVSPQSGETECLAGTRRRSIVRSLSSLVPGRALRSCRRRLG